MHSTTDGKGLTGWRRSGQQRLDRPAQRPGPACARAGSEPEGRRPERERPQAQARPAAAPTAQQVAANRPKCPCLARHRGNHRADAGDWTIWYSSGRGAVRRLTSEAARYCLRCSGDEPLDVRVGRRKLIQALLIAREIPLQLHDS